MPQGHYARKPRTWPAERRERLRELHAKGLGTKEIIAQLGGFEHCVDGGHSAVCGMAWRLGLRVPRAERTRRVARAVKAAGSRWRPPPKPKPVIRPTDPATLAAAALIAATDAAQRRRDQYRSQAVR